VQQVHACPPARTTAVARAIGSSSQQQLLRLAFIGGRGGKLGGKREEDGTGWAKAKEEVAWKNMQAHMWAPGWMWMCRTARKATKLGAGAGRHRCDAPP